MGDESTHLAQLSREDTSLSDLFEIPSAWTWSALGEVATFVNGDRSANYPKQVDFVSTGVAFVNTGHIDPTGRLSRDRMDYISRECFERLRSGKLAKGDIVYCLRGSTIGKTARVDLSEGSVASSLVIIRAKPEVSQDYLYYFLVGPLGQSFVRQHDNGSAQPNLSVSAISRYPIPLPPLTEQRAIAAVLGALDEKIELNRRMNATLEAMARALFQSWFVDFDPVRAKLDGRSPTALDPATAALFPASFDESELGHIPHGWKISTIGDTCQTIFSGGTPSTQTASYWGGNIPWLSSGETRSTFIIETEKTITMAGVENSSTRVAHAGCTVIAGAGQGHTRGQTSLLTIETYINQSVVALAANRKVSSDLFLFFDLARRYDEFRQLSDSHSSRGSLTTTLLAGVKCILPPRELVVAFDKAAQPLTAQITANLHQSRTLANLRDTLLPKLLSGELSVANLKN